MVRRLGMLALAASSLLTAPAATAAGQGEGEGTAASEYVGVTPGLDRKNPLPPPKSSAPQLVWTGFQKAEQGSRVFLQTSSPVNYDITDGKDGKQISVYLRNCRIHLENNQRKLDTRFFDTPVAAVKARQRKKDVEITITLKQAAAPTPRTENGPEGSQYLVLEFAPADRDQPAAME